MYHFQHFRLQRIVPSHIEDGEVAAFQGDMRHTEGMILSELRLG